MRPKKNRSKSIKKFVKTKNKLKKRMSQKELKEVILAQYDEETSKLRSKI